MSYSPSEEFIGWCREWGDKSKDPHRPAPSYYDSVASPLEGVIA